MLLRDWNGLLRKVLIATLVGWLRRLASAVLDRMKMAIATDLKGMWLFMVSNSFLLRLKFFVLLFDLIQDGAS